MGGCGGGRGFGGSEDASVGGPGGSGGSGVGLRGLNTDGADGLAGLLEEVERSGLEREGDGPGKVDAGVFEMAVDEEGDGKEASGGGVGDVARVLVDSDGAGDGGVGRGAIGLGVEMRERERGEKEDGADEGPEVHACDLTSDGGGSRGRSLPLRDGVALNVEGWTRTDGGVTR